MGGINKSGSILTKDFVSEMSFVDSDRVQAILNKANHLLPPGSIVAYMEGYFTGPNNTGSYISTKAINYTDLSKLKITNDYYILADGSICDKPDSIYFGKTTPILTDDRFLMGTSSLPGTSGGSNMLKDHTHSHSLSATLTMSDSYTATHAHPVSGISASSGTFDGHRIPVYSLGFTDKGSYRAVAGDDDGNGDIYGTNFSTHPHSHSASSTTGSDGSFTFSHSHIVDIIPATNGVGNLSYPSNTDKKPKYLSCVYLFKVL